MIVRFNTIAIKLTLASMPLVTTAQVTSEDYHLAAASADAAARLKCFYI
jgi:hypothetical protein